MVRPSRTRRSSMEATISSRAGATLSAAAVGVDVRRSATMSQMQVSGSCPMPVMTGTGQAATARTSPSSLKVMRSSNEPPPRTSRMASGLAAAATASARSMVAGAPGPCTWQPTIWSSTRGFLRRSVRLTSSMTEPERLVTTATRVQKRGMCRLRSGAMRPSASSLRASSATCWRSRPSPATETRLAMNERRPEPTYTSNLPAS